MTLFNLYQGQGTSLGERQQALPPFRPLTRFDDPAGYLADKGLRDAVNVALALALGQPLLVSA